jgi:UDP-glucose 4-epimerase
MGSVLITGGAGFIGANLCRRLLDDGHAIRVVDNLSTGYRSNLDGVDVELVEADIRDRPTLARAARGIDTIVHLAARGSVPRSIEDPLETHDVNVNGTLNVLSVAREGDCHVIFSSSSSVYGANTEIPKRESMRTEPMSPYAASKLAGEAYALSFAHVYDLDVLVFRFFNVYGRLQAAGHAYAAVIPAFLDAMFANRPLRVFGDGKQSRDFTSVISVVEVLARAVRTRATAAGPVNLAFNSNTDLLGLIGLMEELTGRTAAVEFAPARSGDVRASQADPDRLLTLFPGLDPVDLQHGLADTIRWFEQRPSS